jgi:hypothetical protein
MILQLTAIDNTATTPEAQMTPVYIAADKITALRPAALDNPLVGATDSEGNFIYLDVDGKSTIPEVFENMTLVLCMGASFAVTESVGEVLALMQQNVHIAAPGAGANPKVN